MKHEGERRDGPPHVGLIIDTTMSCGRRLLQGVAEYVRENGPWSVYVEPRIPDDPASPWLRNWQCDGIITRLRISTHTKVPLGAGIPIVNLSVGTSGELGRPSILIDQVAIGRMAAEHLLERGFTHFGFVGFPGSYWSDGRYEGFEETVQEAGFSCRQCRGKDWTSQPWRPGLLRQEMHEVADWVRRLPKPVGLMASHDFRAMQLLDACREADVAVPEEAAVIGVDNEDIACELANPPLSSIISGHKQMGREAAALLDRLMRGKPAAEQTIHVPPLGIVTRQSTDVTAIPDPVIAKAMQFIREHACEGINVDDVLRHLVVSRSALQNRFRKMLNRSILEAIHRVRIDRVKELLVKTKLPLGGIAERCGFKHVEYMNTVFRKRTGWTPGKYRTEYGENDQ